MNHVLDEGVEIPHGNGQYLRLSSSLKNIENLPCGVDLPSKIDHSIHNRDAAADCCAADWLLSYYIFLREKPRTGSVAVMRRDSCVDFGAV